MYFINMRRICNIWLVVLAVALLSGCCSRAEEGARDVVAQADSLRAEGKMYGVDAGDSATLAQAYYALTPNYAARVLPEGCVKSLSTDYAHACYHYGRLLRAKDDPVSAMEVFINGTHSRTRDNHILGRIYSNMGSISHLAGEYQLAYDMYQRSADLFLKDGDTLSYCYLLNDMAVECAVQGEKEETMNMVRLIRMKDDESSMIVATCLPLAEVYFKNRQYDSVICYTHEILKNDSNNVTALLITAQSYSFLHVGDSAVHYAKKVLANTTELNNINNALYILTNDDASKDKDAIKETAAARSDIQKLIEIRQGKLSQATQLLEQDLNKKPDYRWLYAILITLIIMGVCIYAYTSRKRRQHKLLSQEVDDIRQEKESLQEETTIIQEKHSQLNESYSKNQQRIVEEIDCKCSLLRESSKIKKALAWKNYDKMCIIVDKQFYLITSKLRSKKILSELEIRLCVLVLLNCNYDQMADLLYRSSTSIGTLKMRVAKKLGTTSKQLRAYLIENECIK